MEVRIPTIWPMLVRGTSLQFCIGRREFPLWNPLIYRETKVPPFKYILNMQNSSMFLLSHILTEWIIEWWMGAATQLLTCRVSTHTLPNCHRAIPRRQKAWLIFSNKARKIDNPCRWNVHISNHPRVSSPSAIPPHQASVFPLARVTYSIPPGFSPSSIPVLLNVPFREALQCVLI